MTTPSDQSASPADNQDQDVTVSAAASTAEDEKLSSESSTEEHEADHSQELLDAIESAVKPKKEEGDKDDDGDQDTPKEEDPKSEEEGDKSDSEKSFEEEEGEKGEETDEEDDDGKDVGPGQKVPYERFNKVIVQRNKAKAELESVVQERDQFKDGHEQFSALQSFMDKNRVTTKDAVQSLELAALINRDPAAALERLTPIYKQLQTYAGQILPEDLQQRVDSGQLAQEDAQALARTRNENANLRQRQQREAQESQQREQQQQVERQRSTMANAANATQQALMKSDPDYAKKDRFIQAELKSLIAERQPQPGQDPAEFATSLVKEAHATVTKQLKNVAPRPENRPGPSSHEAPSRSSASAKEPETMMEAIERAASGSGGG